MSERWIASEGKHAESPKVDAFLADIWTVCERHGMALSHEDEHGSFKVVPIEQWVRDWLMAASDHLKGDR